ncbi:hypothetical protein F0U62_16115 [Cystobacter fuscus]|uniref:hypothetical protein n=1 Tax=Cystobacter fuscus TaxID=43 RepID=UPI002B2CFA6B|nr:hypothetical protein F0U62_16115 [Cystobacter fuscus]
MRLRDFIQQCASTSLEITLHTVFLNTSPVLVLRIEQGKNKPYQDVRNSATWFRANATNRPANPSELKGMVMEGLHQSNEDVG